MNQTMTVEMLGRDATEQDLADFNAAVDRVLETPALDLEEARAYVWHDGEIRLDAGYCISCETLLPDQTDHAPHCD